MQGTLHLVSEMSNCLVEELKTLYTCLFADAKSALPTLGVEFERDLRRLLSLVETRGLHVFVVDLPAVGKHFDRCLSNGQYITSGLPLTKRYTGGTVIPKFLRGLYQLIFDRTGHERECDQRNLAIAWVRQILFAAKRVEGLCSEDNVRTEVRKFIGTDASLPRPNGLWDSDNVSFSDIVSVYSGFTHCLRYVDRIRDKDRGYTEVSSTFLRNLDATSGLLTALLGPYDPSEWCFRHGPGAVSEVVGPTNKYCWKNWSDRLENVYPIADYGFHTWSAWARAQDHLSEMGSRDPGSRLVAVPKTCLKPRLIAAEPSEHQWCQQNLWHYFCEMTRSTEIGRFVHFRDQTHNQYLCRQASIDGSMATIDLSEASDRVTCDLVGNFFRCNPPLVMALQATRTRYITQKLDDLAPEVYKLNKFSTMGSACTFPVQSLVFLAIAWASVLTKRNLEPTAKNIEALRGQVAVFGDDIIIPTDSRLLFTEALDLLDFKVNADKSYWIGRFRESCGVDAYKGIDMTPVYYKAPCNGKPESIAGTVEISNRFYKKWMLNTAAYLASTIPRDIPLKRVDSGVLGLSSFVEPSADMFQRARYNESLQRDEVFTPIVRNRSKKTPIGDDSALLQYFTEAPEPHIMWNGGVEMRPKIRMDQGWVPLTEYTGALRPSEDGSGRGTARDKPKG